MIGVRLARGHLAEEQEVRLGIVGHLDIGYRLVVADHVAEQEGKYSC